jgi:ATP-binding cassette subfamily C protein CydD
VALVAVTVGIRLANGDMPLDTAMLAILLAPEAYWPIRRVGTEFHSAADGAEALNDVISDLDAAIPGQREAGLALSIVHCAETRDAEARGIEAPDIEAREPHGAVVDRVLDGVSYGYPGATTEVLRDMTLDLPIGLTVVTGPSGVGKSTLLELLAGLRHPSAGIITAPRSHLVTQRPFLAAGTVRDNLTLGNDSTDSGLWEVLREVGLDDLVTALADGLDTRLGDDGFGLSAGQRARLTLARAALSTAPLILLDEPTAHLDDQSASLAHHLIQKLAERRTVVAVTHRPELLTLADQHIRLAVRRAPDLAEVHS